MTVVEFFDGVSIVNMASCLSMKPDKIIFIGENKPMEKQNAVFRRFFESCGMNVELDYRPIVSNDIFQIESVLSEIVESDENCVFDLSGGDDLVLVVMGMVFEKYKNTRRIEMHKVNIRTGKVIDCDFNGILPDRIAPQLSVKDNILLYGGRVVPFCGEKGTSDWDMSEDFRNDLIHMWQICKKNPGLWNSVTGSIGAGVECHPEANSGMDISFDVEETKEEMAKVKKKFKWVKGVAESFEKCGLISDLQQNESNISFTFKNEQVKKCLTKEGILLELMVLMFVQKATEKDGTPKYNDSLNGVYIDWDSELHDITDDEKDTENEIDVIAMKGMVPIFISCKNGYIPEDELYKLNTVAEKFGGPYAKKVLVATYLGNMSAKKQKYFIQRAEDMNIELIYNVHEMSDEEFAKKIRNIRW